MGKEHENEVLQRYSFTLPPNLIEHLDDMVERMGINRSMVVREALTHWVDHKMKEIDFEGSGVAVLSYLYDHHDTRVVTEIMQKQHNYDETITTTSHIHLSHQLCFEIIICKGEIRVIKQLLNDLRTIKGIQSLNFSYTRE